MVFSSAGSTPRVTGLSHARTVQVASERVYFFAHTQEQLRVLPQQSPRSVDSYDGSPLRAKTLHFMTSPGSASPPATPPAESPPISPMTQSLSQFLGSNSVNVKEMMASLRNLQLGKVMSLPSSWNVPMGSPCFGSPRGPVIRPGFCSLPSTPTQVPVLGGVNCFDLWDQTCEEELVMERVESGRDIQAKMFEKLSRENSLGRSGPCPVGGAPDVGGFRSF